ncbi:hypothetical protein ACO0RG_001260 [Hanseniaspora osmophila]
MSAATENFTSSAALLAKYLPQDEQKKLITDLIQNEQYFELENVLHSVDFLPGVIEETAPVVSEKVIEKLSKFVLVTSTDDAGPSSKVSDVTLSYLSEIIKFFPSVFNQLNDFIVGSILLYITNNKFTLFHPAFEAQFVNLVVSSSSIQSAHGNTENKEVDITKLFDFLEKVFLNFENYCNKTLDKLLLLLINCKNDQISTLSSKLTRWRTTSILSYVALDQEMDQFVWSLIPYVLSPTVNENQKPFVKKNTYSVWLRLLMKMFPLVKPKKSSDQQTITNNSKAFCNFLETENYWHLIQFGLSQDSAEIRKISLSILKVTLQACTSVPFYMDLKIENSCIKVHPSKNTNQWKKFTTLYEIVAVDTALNQFKDATQDFLDLFKSSGVSMIEPSWGLIILSTGMKSSMEGVRKYSLQLLFLIQDRAVFHSKLDELQTVFLPCAMIAANFDITSTPETTTQFSCPYGEKFLQFVKDLITSSYSNNGDISANTEQKNNVLDCLLQTLCDFKSSYDPARLYLTLGIYQALLSLSSSFSTTDLLLNNTHIEMLEQAVFKVECEDKLFEMVLQITALKMMCFYNTNIETSSPYQWLSVITSHAKKFGYEFLEYVLEDLREFCVVNFKETNFAASTINSQDTVFSVLAYCLFSEFDRDTFEITPEFLLELSKIDTLPKFNKENLQLITEVYNGNAITTKNDISSLLQAVENVNWNTFQLSQIEQILLSSPFDPPQFSNLVYLYEKVLKESMQYPSLKLEDLLKYYNRVVEHAEKNKHLNSKHKDFWFKTYFQLVQLYIKSNGISDIEELQKIFLVMKKNLRDNGNYLANLEMINICKYLFDKIIVFDSKYDQIVCDDMRFVLNEIWEIVSCERLVLNQRALHLTFIQTFFHKQMLHRCNSKTVDSSSKHELITNLITNGNQIIDASITRRTLLPLLSKQLLNYVTSNAEKSENHIWLIELFKHGMLTCPADANVYKFKELMGTVFDAQFSNEFKYFFPQGLYQHIYGEPEIMGKVSLVGCVLKSSKEFQQALLEDLFSKEVNMFKAIKRNDGNEEMQRIIKWQMATLVLPNADNDILENHVCDQLIPSLINDESSPSCRYYSEWIVAFSIVKKQHDTENKNLTHLMNMFQNENIIDSPVWLVSCVRVLFLIMSYLDDLTLIKQFLTILISHCTSNKPLIRHFCNSLILSVWPKFKDVLHENNELELYQILGKLYEFSKQIQVHGQYRSGDANVWDLFKDLTLTNIFGGLIYKISDHEVPFYIDARYFESKLGSLNLNTSIQLGIDDKSSWLKKRNTKLHHEETMNFKKTILTDTLDASKNSTPLQTKSGAWNLVFDVDNKKSNANIERSDLIVMASLVDKPPNLGGICRLCDVLGCGLLTVDDIKVKSHPQFKNVAVTADKWMPMEQVKIDEIVEFLTQKKKEGYTLIGLEQTDKSVKLDNNYKFPKKTVIVLGIEAFGIPGYILEHLDLCLEIQQFGVIRSMNIQTATAVICYAYTIQHM